MTVFPDNRNEYYATLPIGDNDYQRRKRMEQRNQEYNAFINKQPSPRRVTFQEQTNNQSYGDILDSKRRLEALYRKENDPSYFEGLERSKTFTNQQEFTNLEDEYLNALNRLRQARDRVSPRRDFSSPRQAAPQYQPTRVQSARPVDSKRQRQEKYRLELEQQIAEKQRMKMREKQLEMKVNASDARDPEKDANRLKHLLPQDVTTWNGNSRPFPATPQVVLQPPQQQSFPRTHYQDTFQHQEIPTRFAPQPQVQNFVPQQDPVPFHPPSHQTLIGRVPGVWENPVTPRLEKINVGLLDVGDILSKPMINPNYIAPNLAESAMGQPLPLKPMQLGNTDYNYYAEKDPMIPGPVAYGNIAVNLEPQPTKPGISTTSHINAPFATNNDAGSADMKRKLYKMELQQQMQEQELKRAREKADQDAFDRKFEREVEVYDPFRSNKGGGGEPIKDVSGNVVADFRVLKREAPNIQSPRGKYDLSPRPRRKLDISFSPRARLEMKSPSKGMFGDSREELANAARERWKEDLERQMEEKRRQDERERARREAEEAREEQRMKEQNERIRREFEEEQRAKREKAAEQERLNDELREQAEAKRKADMQQKRDERASHLVDMPPAAGRGSGFNKPSSRPIFRDHGSRQLYSRAVLDGAKSAEILKQLTVMREQLADERARVERQVKAEHVIEVGGNVDDLDLDAMGSRRRNDSEASEEIRELFKKKTPSPSPLPSNSKQLKRFKKLKYDPKPDSTREILLKEYPTEPKTEIGLEEQQKRLLRKQTDSLFKTRQLQRYNQKRRRPLTTSGKLYSESDFISVPPSRDDTVSHQKKQHPASAKSRVSEWSITSNGPGPKAKKEQDKDTVSDFSLNIDALNRRNLERTEKLEASKYPTLEAISSMSFGEKSVSDIFGERGKETKRISGVPKLDGNFEGYGQSLDDDTWINPSPRGSVSG